MRVRIGPLSYPLVFWRWLAVGLLGIYVLTVLTVGGASWSRYVFRSLACLWVVGLTGSWWSKPGVLMGWAKARWFRRLDILATNVAIFLLVAELSLRVYAACNGNSLLIQNGLAAYRLAPHHNYGDLLFTNNLGYPSREFEKQKRPGVQRVAALGDSFAVGVVRQDQNFLTLLEKQTPGIEVYNFGVSCTGPREYLDILQREAWTYSPDVVLLCFFVGNDVTELMPLPDTHMMHPESYSLYLFGQRAWRLGREWYRRQRDPASDRMVHQPFQFGFLSEETHLHVEAERLKICRKSEVEAIEKKWGRTLADVDKIIQACEHRKTPLRVVLIPDEFQVNPVLLQDVLTHAGVERGDVDLDLPQRRLQAFFGERGIPCLDLKPAFEGVADTYRPRDTHWNEGGNQLAAAKIAQWFELLALSSNKSGSTP